MGPVGLEREKRGNILIFGKPEVGRPIAAEHMSAEPYSIQIVSKSFWVHTSGYPERIGDFVP